MTGVQTCALPIYDLNRAQFDAAVGAFAARLPAGATAFVYYAGHGMQVRGKNYLIPVDAEIDSEDMVASESIDLGSLLESLKPSKLNIVILDACRDNPFARGRRSGEQRNTEEIQ